jgi:peptide/nickel transport system substrate-binding protein
MHVTNWTRLASNRLSRRRTLAITGAGALGAAFLAACGGGGSSSEKSSDKSGLLANAADTTKQAKVGGIWRSTYARDATSFDPAFQGTGANALARTNNTLVTFQMGVLSDSTANVIPELVQAWEYSPDRMALTLKLRRDVKWHNKAPVNGRQFDADDVVFTLDRAQQKASNRGNFFSSINPDALFRSWSKVDQYTVTIQLTKPVYYALASLASSLGGNISVLPKETDTTFDARRDAIGTGPYFLAEYNPSVSYKFKRNPEYFDKGNAGFIDEIEQPIVPEYAAQLAQFKAGNIYAWDYTTGVTAEDILPTKRDTPELALYSLPILVGPRLPIHSIDFGWLPEGKSPFLDQRVRQAVSMSLARDLWISTFYNTDSFTSQGLPVNVRWSSSVWADRDGWLDPKGKDFGPNAKYFNHDIAEAKKLLLAAGHGAGLSVTSTITTGGYGASHGKATDVIEGMLSEAGFKPQRNDVDNTKEFIPKYREATGKYEGWAMKVAGGDLIDATMRMRSEFYSKAGQGFLGFTPDSQFDGMVEKAVLEFDTDKRTQQAYDMQRYLAEKMYGVKWPGGASGFGLAWPVVKNFAVFNGVPFYSKDPAFFYWLDQTKAPLKKT